jgi:hypothetical protein
MKGLFDPESYYLVLFDFSAEEEVAQTSAAGEESTSEVMTDQPLDINARIWQGVVSSHTCTLRGVQSVSPARRVL